MATSSSKPPSMPGIEPPTRSPMLTVAILCDSVLLERHLYVA